MVGRGRWVIRPAQACRPERISGALARRQPGLQVARAAEVEQILGELLNVRKGEGGEAIPVGLIHSPEPSGQLTNSQSGGLLPTPFLQDHLHSAGVAQLLQGKCIDHEDLLPAELSEALKQHRENNRLQISAFRQHAPGTLLRKDEAETSVLFELVMPRYERRSVLVISNQPFREWENVFFTSAMTVAAVDRLVDHSTLIQINGESYRRKRARRVGGPAKG